MIYSNQDVMPEKLTGSVLYSDSSFAIELRKYPKGYSMPAHTHDYLTISLLLHGNLVEDSDNGSVQPYSGFLSIKPQNVLHSDVFVNDCIFLSLKVFDPCYYHLNFRDWRWLFPSGFISYLIPIIHGHDKKQSIHTMKDFLYKMEQAERLPIPQWLLQVHTIVCVHYRESFQIKDIAREVGKHPFYLGRTFERFYGSDIISYRQNLRLHHALSDAVIHPDKTFAEIAYEHGFSDQSHFTREVKKVLAISPKKAKSFLKV
ncbi:AraC family transcriptional regulator [Cytophagaceae bacterium YF14B1]|uniref:AraC family transcriptional regulator n=1 Tax=Xanthocytophaga flava TaxID=3048013 RepID=A0AAE3QST7_9BACT|nr:AraC family transcriptional regulator [Xanthocytophaga flavus]MDJ1484296.1 AraC family transcriptional regulator [Xanthocytophaga flavus]